MAAHRPRRGAEGMGQLDRGQRPSVAQRRQDFGAGRIADQYRELSGVLAFGHDRLVTELSLVGKPSRYPVVSQFEN